MKKFIDTIDFWKGQKTMIGSIATVLSLLLGLMFGVDITSIELSDNIIQLITQVSTILSSLLAIYGLIMKFVRKIND